jgi:hypothetical protein
MRASLPLSVTAMLLVVACTESPATDELGSLLPTAPTASTALLSGGATPDLSGAWNWSRVEQLTMPSWVAEFVFGIDPEGPITRVTCAPSGTMTLIQTGATFTGTATQTTHNCETAGGQQFQSSDAAIPIVVAEGRISGRAIRFSWAGPTVNPCPHQATISVIQGDTAVALTGTGHCFVPGHPKSESPIVLDPPPAGTSKILTWQAVRP